MWPFGRKKTDPAAATETSPAAASVVAADQSGDDTPAVIKVFDPYGREVAIPRESWRTDVLLPNLEKSKDNPDALYSMIVDSLQNGFAEDVLPFAEHLQKISPDPLRGAVILGIVYLELGRLDEAEGAFRNYLAQHGEQHTEAGLIYTNLAKVYAARGKESLVEATLWHALQLDPNQSIGFGWFLARQHQQGGEAGVQAGLQQLVAIPKSWRARLGIARQALTQKDIETATRLYREAIELADQPPPADLLMEMSGDLGTNGFLEELLSLVSPHFEVTIHGLPVGNNLIKANFDLQRFDVAHQLVELLYAQQNPSWRNGLDYWDRELAKVGVESKNRGEPKPPQVVSFTIDAPLWARNGSPFLAIVPNKTDDATRIVVIGSSVVFADAPKRPVAQLSDGPGRLSRVVPLVLAEHIQLQTNCFGSVLMPWAQGQGFVLYGAAFTDADLCRMVAGAEKAPQFIVGVTINATATENSEYIIALRLLRASDGALLAEKTMRAAGNDPGPAIERLIKDFEKVLVEHTGLKTVPPPTWYQRPTGGESSEYLLRMEQQLAVICCNLEFLNGGTLTGEREILDGVIQLALRQAQNPTARILLAQTLREMKKARPAVIAEYATKIRTLQQQYPLPGEVAPGVEAALSEALA